MEQRERSDPMFSIFVVAAFVFIVVLMYVTFPRPEGPHPHCPMQRNHLSRSEPQVRFPTDTSDSRFAI